MLGPQVRNMEKRLRELTSTPIEVINMRDYGMMNGEKVLDANVIKLIMLEFKSDDISADILF